MANIAQLVNVLQALILTEEDKMLLTPTYHVFDLYQEHKGATFLPVRLASEAYTQGDKSIPALSATASRSSDGTIHLSIVNVHPSKSISLDCETGGRLKSGTGRILTSDNVHAHNTFDAVDRVKVTEFKDFRINKGKLNIEIPARSVITLSLK